jgi:DNA-binding CsgD family transcriptional regulator
VNDPLFDRIYEAAVLPHRWPDLLQTIADTVGGRGSVIFSGSMDGSHIIASAGAEQLISDFVSAGWMENNPRATPLVEAMHPGFQTDTEFFSMEEKAMMPVYREFLIPRGFSIGAGTVVQGAHDDALVMTVEGFADDGVARRSVATLDALRPHLARAMSLSARIAASRAAATVQGLEVAGTPAAVVGANGGLRAANARFTARLGNLMIERRPRLSFTDRTLDRRFAQALALHRQGHTGAESIVVRGGEDVPFVIHLLPLRGSAPDAFESDGLLLLLADGANASIPNADLLRLLFDLTPAEARLTRRLLEGHTLAEAAGMSGVAEGTARAQLKAVFAKTGINRQAELIRVLSSYAAPR